MDPLRRQFRALLAEEDLRDLDRLVNLSVRVDAHDGTPLYRAGGVWDRELRRYAGWQKPHVIRLKKSQAEAAQYALWWIQERKAGRPRDFVLEFLIGDRGGGKTAMGSILAGLFVLEFPSLDGSPTIAWQVSKSHDERDEVDRELRAFFPFEGRWYTYTEYRGHKYRWVNGAEIKNISADDEESLKRGRVDFIFGNEVGKMGKRMPVYGMGRLKDKGGFGFFTSNRPTQRSRWILHLHKKAEEARLAGQTYPVVFVKVGSADNDTLDRPTADQVSLIVNDIDPSLADDDMGALFDPVNKVAYRHFSRALNVRLPPELGDITAQFTRVKAGTAYNVIGSADFQGNDPGVVATFWKVFGTMEAPIFWAIGEHEGGAQHSTGSEDEFCEELKDDGVFTPGNTMFTGDNTGATQAANHDPKERTSFAVFKAQGFKIVPNVKPKELGHNPANPRVERRMRLVNMLLATIAPGGGAAETAPRHIMVSPKCPRLIHALEECEIKISGKFGLPYPAHPFSHLTDTAGYIAWWGWPKPKMPGPTKAPGIEQIQIHRRQVW